MATKASLEVELEETKAELKKYRQWLMESEEKYNKLVDEKETLLEGLPAYKQAMTRNKNLEIINKANEKTITRLKNKLAAYEVENSQLRETVKNINDSKKAGRKPKSPEKIQKQLDQLKALLDKGLKGKDICHEMGISESTLYRLKKFICY